MTSSGPRVKERLRIASGSKQTCSVVSLDPAINTYHLELKEKLECLIYNLDLEKAKQVLEDLNPKLIESDQSLKADMSLAQLYILMRDDKLEEGLSYASSIVIPLIHGKAIVHNSESSRSYL
jgi:hypothetical protein